MHFLFRLDLSLHASAGKKNLEFGIWNPNTGQACEHFNSSALWHGVPTSCVPEDDVGKKEQGARKESASPALPSWDPQRAGQLVS